MENKDLIAGVLAVFTIAGAIALKLAVEKFMDRRKKIKLIEIFKKDRFYGRYFMEIRDIL
jgi:hypothetical protein